jgi:uncharacterized protein YkwD
MKKPDPKEMLETVESVKKEADELMMKKIDHYEKELALVREDAQISILQKEKYISSLEKQIQKKNETIHLLQTIEKSHQKLNGELREDNKKLARQVDDYTNQLRKAGVI